MTRERVFGHIPGVEVGAVFESRPEVAQSGVHRPTQGGISGGENEGADSIVVSGGYEDDEDQGDEIVYTGHGGNRGGVQVAGQIFRRGNKALAVSCDRGLPVRVVRGSGGDPRFSLTAGFRYDGLFYVADYWSKTGRSGHLVYRYRLNALEDSGPWGIARSPEESETPDRVPGTVQRLVRDTSVTRWVKELYDYTCQMCGARLEAPSGRVVGTLRLLEGHEPDSAHLEYHREHRRLGRTDPAAPDP